MKNSFIFLILLLLLPVSVFAQDSHASMELIRQYSPFKENGYIVDCFRDWMMPKERMDSLKHEVKYLEEQLKTLPTISADFHTVSFVKLFESEYEVKIEALGEVNEQFCVSDSEAGKVLEKVYGSPITREPFKIYENYLVITRESYYLGNCQKLTTVKEYYIRK